MASNTVGQVVPVLSADQALTARDCGFTFAKNQIESVETAQSFARALGADCTFDQWEAARLAWVDGYCEANPANTGNAADKGWSRFAGILNELFGMVKPKAVSAAAVKKATEREAKKAELLGKYSQLPPTMIRAQLEAAYQTLAKDPASKAAAAQAKELGTVLKAKIKEEKAEEAEELTALRKEVKAAAAECDSLNTLTAALDILKGE